MEHALVKIEQNAPAAIAQTPVALKTGHLNYGSDLFKVYISDETKESTQVQLIVNIAADGLTPEEFAEQCKNAQKLADETDKANGWKPAEGAKGAELYGPKRKVLNQRLSEAKQIFGAVKMAPDLCKEKGYWSSLAAARDYLADKGLKWDGTPLLDAQAKKAQRQQKATKGAIAEVMGELTQQPGEDMGEYLTRVQEHAKAKLFEDEVNTIVNEVTKKHGQGDATLTAAMRIIEAIASPAQMHDFAQYLHECALFLTAGEEAKA